jgi:hypothetical protein
MPSNDLTMIGWRERVDLPEWGVRRIRAKIDTGARTSAIDVAQIEPLAEDRVRFEVVVRDRPERVTKWIEADTARQSVVKPSSGERQQRVVCRTTMGIAGIEHEIELSLVCRKGMLCRMLIGRTALAGVFSVDPSRKYVLTAAKKTTAEGEGGR